jgi:hypothetical protein
MERGVYRFAFDKAINMREAEETLLLAVLAVESLFGESTVRLDASFSVDSSHRACVIDASTDVGRAICRVFTGFVSREFGGDAFQIHRVDSPPARETAACAAAC